MSLYHNLLNKYKLLSKPAKASLWFVACYVIQRGLQFIGMPIYTRIMSTEEYGIYSVFLSWFNLLCVFTSMNIYSGTLNKAMVKYEAECDSYISSVQWLTLIISIVFSVLIVILNRKITSVTGFSIKHLLLMCVHLIAFPSLQYWSQKQRFLFEYKKLVIVTLINSVSSLCLGIVFVLVSSEKSFALILATVSIQFVINGVLFISLSAKGKTFYNRDYWSWSCLTALPLIPHYLAEILLGHADRLMINQMCGPAQAGIYNIVYQISMVMTIIRTGINGSYAPWLYYSLKAKRFVEIKRISRLLTLMMASMTLLFILIGPEILKIVAPPTYFEASVGIPAIMLGCYFIYIYVLFMYVEVYYEKTRGVAIASVTAAIFNVILNYVCINTFGYITAAYTTMVSYMLMSFMHYLFFRKLLKLEPELAEVYDFKTILISSVILVVTGILLLFIYHWVIVRIALLFSIIIVGYLKRTLIIDTISILRKRD